jgi:hypothetical protein
MEAELSETTRKAVRESVHRVLRVVGHELEVSPESHDIPGDAGEVYNHLDGLVRIVRRTPGDDVSKFLAQLPAEVCHDCRHQFESGFCPLRHRRMCTLQIAALPVYEAIGGALRNVEDPEYCETRATMTEPEDAAEPCACHGGKPCTTCAASEFFG